MSTLVVLLGSRLTSSSEDPGSSQQASAHRCTVMVSMMAWALARKAGARVVRLRRLQGTPLLVVVSPWLWCDVTIVRFTNRERESL